MPTTLLGPRGADQAAKIKRIEWLFKSLTLELNEPKGWAGWNVGEAGMGSSLGEWRAGGTHRAVADLGLRPLMATRLSTYGG